VVILGELAQSEGPRHGHRGEAVGGTDKEVRRVEFDRLDALDWAIDQWNLRFPPRRLTPTPMRSRSTPPSEFAHYGFAASGAISRSAYGIDYAFRRPATKLST